MIILYENDCENPKKVPVPWTGLWCPIDAIGGDLQNDTINTFYGTNENQFNQTSLNEVLVVK